MVNAAPSREHSKLAPGSSAAKVSVASVSEVVVSGPSLIEVCGAVVSGGSTTVQLWVAALWSVLPAAIKGSLFLLALVLSASMMPVDSLPAASAGTTFGLGFISAVFDNIPLTKLALEQGGYDWAALAYAVGFGGSMLWFGSSAGVAVSNLFPEAKSVGHWLRHGWYVAVGYVVGFVIFIAIVGWNPERVN